MTEDRKLLEETVRDLHKNETFEKALGRILRRHGRGYPDYLRIVANVREHASARKVDLATAAAELAQS